MLLQKYMFYLSLCQEKKRVNQWKYSFVHILLITIDNFIGISSYSSNEY